MDSEIKPFKTQMQSCLCVLPQEFKQALKSEFEKRAETDSKLADLLKKENKSFEECEKYIEYKLLEIAKNMERKNNLVCLQLNDEDVYKWAEIYFADDSIKYEEPKPKVTMPTPTTKTKGSKDNIKPFVPKETPKKEETKEGTMLSLF